MQIKNKFIILFLIIFLSCKGNETYKIFDISVGKKTMDLKMEIESMYGKPIKFKSFSKNSFLGFADGLSTVSPGGIPIIQLNTKKADEETIYHELLHLKNYLNKTSSSAYVLDGTAVVLNDNSNQRFVQYIRVNISSAMSHRLFVYPEMLKNGFDDGIDEIKELIRNRDFSYSGKSNLSMDDKINITLKYLTFKLEYDKNKELISDLETWYKDEGWDDYSSIAEEMYNFCLTHLNDIYDRGEAIEYCLDTFIKLTIHKDLKVEFLGVKKRISNDKITCYMNTFIIDSEIPD